MSSRTNYQVPPEITTADWNRLFGSLQLDSGSNPPLVLPFGVKGFYQYAANTSDVSTTATTLSDITGLNFPVSAGKTYIFEGYIIFQTAATTTGISLSGNGPASPTYYVMRKTIPISLTASEERMERAYDTNQPSSGVDTANANCLAYLWGVIRPSANGTFTLRVASEVSGSAVTVKAGSVLIWREI